MKPGSNAASHVALLRGINVGGKNLIRMVDLAALLVEEGYAGVKTYIQSGNVVFAPRDPNAGNADLEAELERSIGRHFGVETMVVVRSRDELARVVVAAPATHGDGAYRSDVMFLKDPVRTNDVLATFPDLHPEADSVASGPGVIYFARVDALASQSRLTKIVGTAIYREMTIRNWRTTTRLLELFE